MSQTIPFWHAKHGTRTVGVFAPDREAARAMGAQRMRGSA
jgi:hypothetical protein